MGFFNRFKPQATVTPPKPAPLAAAQMLEQQRKEREEAKRKAEEARKAAFEYMVAICEPMAPRLLVDALVGDDTTKATALSRLAEIRPYIRDHFSPVPFDQAVPSDQDQAVPFVPTEPEPPSVG